MTRSSLLSLVVSHFSERALSGVPRGSRLQSLDSELDVLENSLRQARRIRNMQTGACRKVIPQVRIFQDVISLVVLEAIKNMLGQAN